MSALDLRALVRDIAEAAAKCVGADASQTQPRVASGDVFAGNNPHAVDLTASAGAWRSHAAAYGHAGAALDAAAVIALRERVQRQRDERARMLAADDAALRVIDETARVYDAATVQEALDAMREGADPDALAWHAKPFATLDDHGAKPPWSRAEIRRTTLASDLVDACDAILRRRAGGAP